MLTKASFQDSQQRKNSFLSQYAGINGNNNVGNEYHKRFCNCPQNQLPQKTQAQSKQPTSQKLDGGIALTEHELYTFVQKEENNAAKYGRGINGNDNVGNEIYVTFCCCPQNISPPKAS